MAQPRIKLEIARYHDPDEEWGILPKYRYTVRLYRSILSFFGHEFWSFKGCIDKNLHGEKFPESACTCRDVYIWITPESIEKYGCLDDLETATQLLLDYKKLYKSTGSKNAFAEPYTVVHTETL